MPLLPTVLVTGASSGIGALYADRFARRGHPLVLVARRGERLETMAADIRARGGEAEVLVADLTAPADLARVEERLRADDIGVLVNNAGTAGRSTFLKPDLAEFQTLIDLNVTAPTRLAGAALPGFLARGGCAIINVASVVGLIPEIAFGAYGATKAYLIHLSQSMQAHVDGRVYIQAVLPCQTRTEIWERTGRDPDTIPNMMDADVFVDAALVGYDRGELITIPPLPDAGQWEAFDAARKAMTPNLAQAHAAARYQRGD